MSLEYFEGPAGSGKTHNLIKRLNEIITTSALSKDQGILALTFMHGARRRISARLQTSPLFKGRFTAITIDSLAALIVHRWRSLATTLESMVLPTSTDFDRTCEVAARLLARPIVSKWLVQQFPIVVVDEFQDCSTHRLAIIQRIEAYATVLIAADEFQRLRDSAHNEAVQWLHSHPECGTPLAGNWRTSENRLLTAASLLRNGQDIGKSLGSNCISGRNHNSAAGRVAFFLTTRPRVDVALLTPTRPGNSLFVRNVVNRLMEKSIKPAGLNKEVGPFPISWETSPEEEQQSCLDKLGFEKNARNETKELADIERAALAHAPKGGLQKDLSNWASRRRRLKGQTTFTQPELVESIAFLAQARRSFTVDKSWGIRAMTIDQAKNREFANVIVLWPYEVQADKEILRRLLYNAITRAKESVLLIVQDPSGSRIREFPFSI